MAFQSPLIAIPKKTTQDVDWTNPIRQVIAHSYGEDPNNYAEECAVLQRCRQDGVRGAGSDFTARDLLYKYFGQLELLELRFAEIKVSFPWNDAFTDKLTTQTSLAFEKASIIHLIAAVLSSLAQSPSRSDPEGLKRAYYNTRASAGMLTYINENFLHAPSTDLSREVVHLLIGIMMAQATEIFTEKLVEEKKAPALVARSANQAAALYTVVVDELKDFQGKGVFDRNWLYVLQIKSKLFASVAQYYRAVADSAAGKHGASLVRLRLADSLVQEAQRQASSFTYTFVSSSTASLPHDAATSLHEITKAHAAVCSETKTQATRDNDLIYHEVLPSEASLPAIDKLPAAPPITIQEVYGNPEVTKLIGPDIFIKLVPLAVHESASVYSEEKAKLVRGEVERVDLSEGEIRAGLEHMGLPGAVNRWNQLAEDDGEEESVELSAEVRRLVDSVEPVSAVEAQVARLQAERERWEREFRDLSSTLDNESRECERMRAKYTPNFTQPPSGPQTTHLRTNISSNLTAISTAAQSDNDLLSAWKAIQPDIALLSSGRANVERAARDVAQGTQPVTDKAVSLLDLQDDVGGKKGLDEGEKEGLKKAAGECKEKLDRLGKIRRERDEVLKDLKEKVQTDDVSSLLLLNRRTQNVEPQLFASELEKFRPYQSRLTAAVQASKALLSELETLVSTVQRGRGVRELQRGEKDRQRRLREWEGRLERAGGEYFGVKETLGKGLAFYASLGEAVETLKKEVKRFVEKRDAERSKMVSELETRQRLGAGSPAASPGAGASSGSRGLEERLAALSVGGVPTPPQPPRPAVPSTPSGLPAPPGQQASTPHYPPPPPPQKTASNPYDFSSLGGYSAFSTAPPASASAPAPPQQQRQASYGSPSYPSYPAPPQQQASSPYPAPPAQPARPSRPSYGSYNAPSPSAGYPSAPPPQPQAQAQSPYPAPPSKPSYPSHPPPTQQQPPQGYASPPPQQTPGYYNPQYPSHPPPVSSPYGAPSPASPVGQGQTQQYPNYPPPGQTYAPPPQQQQQGGYPSYPPPGGYQPPAQQQQPQYGGQYQYGYANGGQQQPQGQGGYQYR
ncbi:hypothetical protein IAT38_001790 [Cryptococcus sp. DSM 104549]